MSNAYNPKLSFYHPNGKGTGACLSLQLIRATEENDGGVLARIAPQKSLSGYNNGVRMFPTFDWENAIEVRLGVVDVGHILEVFRGMAESACDGRGMFFGDEFKVSLVKVSHRIEPVPGYMFEFTERVKANGEEKRFFIVLSCAEALALCHALESGLKEMCFG